MKKIKVWHIAMIHTLLGGVASALIPLSIFTLIAVLLGVQTENINKNVPFQFMTEIMQIIAIWLGSRLSANFITKRYVISNPKRTLILSTTYLGIFLYISFAIGFLDLPPYYRISLPVIVICGVGAPLSCMVFYFETRKKLLTKK